MITITEKEKEKRFSIEITIKDILNVLDEAKKRKIVKFGTNDVCKNLSKYHYFGDYKYLYFCFNLVNEVPIISEDNADYRYFNINFEKEYLKIIGAYYKCYCELFGVEPFNLAQALYDYIEVGGEYGDYDSPFDICTYKDLSDNGTIKVKMLFCNSRAGFPIFPEKEETKRFKINLGNKNFISDIEEFSDCFENLNQGHYPLDDDYDVDDDDDDEEIEEDEDVNERTEYEKMDIIEATKETIKRNKRALRILLKLKETK